jgi:acyl-CoA thioesterase-1
VRSLGPLAVLVLLVGVHSATAAGPPVTVARNDGPVIVALGDSLTAGFGVTPEEAYPARLAERLAREGYPYRVINAGVSGDTSAGAYRRVGWVLRAKPEIVIVAVGANDGLRGQNVEELRRNLESIVRRIRASGARVLLVGMRLPPNYGDGFAREFAATYFEVARRTAVPVVPFLLDGVAGNAALNQADGIHPNAEGHRVIVEQLWPYLEPLLRKRPDARPTR